MRGFAHVGVLEALNNAQVPVDMISGTSMGSVVGSLYAAGLPTEKLWTIGEHMTMDKITSDFNVIGLFRLLFAKRLPTSSNLVNFFHEQVGDMRFEDMQIPFSCAAMDVKTGERVVFDSGPLAIAVRASMNLPGIFAPVQYRHRELVDGAVVDYLPVESVKSMGADYIIASITPPESAHKANFVITNRVLDVGTLELDKLHKAGEVGLQEANRHMGEMQENILLFALPYVLKP